MTVDDCIRDVGYRGNLSPLNIDDLSILRANTHKRAKMRASSARVIDDRARARARRVRSILLFFFLS